MDRKNACGGKKNNREAPWTCLTRKIQYHDQQSRKYIAPYDYGPDIFFDPEIEVIVSFHKQAAVF
jgi:hypothetical protein